MKIEVDKSVIDELESRINIYSFLLSAITRKMGILNEENDQYELHVTLPMLQNVEGTNLLTTNEVNPVTQEPFTRVHIYKNTRSEW